jgi:lipocalin
MLKVSFFGPLGYNVAIDKEYKYALVAGGALTIYGFVS